MSSGETVPPSPTLQFNNSTLPFNFPFGFLKNTKEMSVESGEEESDAKSPRSEFTSSDADEMGEENAESSSDPPKQEAGTPLGGSSSSRRKRFQPQKQTIKDEEEEEEEDRESHSSNNPIEERPKERNNVSESSAAAALAAQFAANCNGNFNPLRFRELLDAQRQMCAVLSPQKPPLSMSAGKDEEAQRLNELLRPAFARFASVITSEITNTVRKVLTEISPSEIEKIIEQYMSKCTEQQQQRERLEQQKQQQWRNQARLAAIGVPPSHSFNPLGIPFPNNGLMGLPPNPLNVGPNSSNGNTNTNTTNPIDSAPKLNPPSGIFPSPFPQFGQFMNPMFRNEEGMPRKKRSKVTDSVRGSRAAAVRDTGNSLPASGRSSPLPSGYFPPTMVAHPHYGSFKLDNTMQSPTHSEDPNEFEYDEGGYSQSSTLTHVHLRKAKLMFFYTRYPTSAVLKSYFPDINFNKSNTAQLVKWFSNFREFYYMQMEKFAKQAIADGIVDASQLKVTIDSEIYKQLNQHYNRNNFISPPEALPGVIEETLKEFFRAMQEGRNAEPSWKKSIYKVIQQLDEPIPECFKSPHFMIQLEGN